MKNILVLASILILLPACARINYAVVKPDGTKASASATSFFSNQAIKGFNADSSTEKTKTGLKFATSDTSPAEQALNDLYNAIGTAAGTAAKTALKP